MNVDSDFAVIISIGILKEVILIIIFITQILWKVDTILFSLLILRGLCDSHGRVWRCNPDQLYAIEVTLPDMERVKDILPQRRILTLLKLMPSVTCLSPRKAMSHKQAGISIVHGQCQLLLLN